MIVALIIVLVVLFLLFKFTLKQKTGEPFSKKSLTKFIVFGLLTAVILITLTQLAPIDPHFFFGKMNSQRLVFVTAFLLAALPEEVIKYIMFRLAIMKNGEIKVVHDVVIVCAIIGCGFTLLENIQYVVFEGSSAVVRVLVPAHLLFQIIMGYFYGRAKAENKPLYHVLALGVPIVLHTFFDAFMIAMMDALGDIDSLRGMTMEELAKLPNYNLIIPLFVGMLLVLVAAFVGIIVAFVKIKKNRESAVMQEPLN